MAEADPPKEASTVKKMGGRSLLLSSNKITHYIKEWMTVLKKNNLQKCGASRKKVNPFMHNVVKWPNIKNLAV